MTASSADKRLARIASIRRTRPTAFNLSRPLIVERARLTAEREGRPRPTENEALAQAAPVVRTNTGRQGDAMATVVKKVVRRGFPPSKPVQKPAQRPVRTSQAENPQYYAHLNNARDQQDNRTRSTSHRPTNPSDVGPEGVGRSPEHGKVVNEQDEGRYEANLDPDEQKELEKIAEERKMRRNSYNRNERMQKRERELLAKKYALPA